MARQNPRHRGPEGSRGAKHAYRLKVCTAKVDSDNCLCRNVYLVEDDRKVIFYVKMLIFVCPNRTCINLKNRSIFKDSLAKMNFE